MNIYGKDYATGKPSEGFTDAIKNMLKTAPAQVSLLDSSDEDDVAGSVNATQTQTVESAPLLKR